MKRKACNVAQISIVAIAILSVVVLSCFNIANAENIIPFFKTTLVDIGSLSLTSVLGFFIISMRSKKSKFNSNYENLLSKFQKNFDTGIDNFFCDDDEKTRQNILSHIRTVSNQVTLLKKYSEILDIHEGIDALCSIVEEYKYLLSENIHQKQALISISQERTKLLQKIDNECENIKIKLYV